MVSFDGSVTSTAFPLYDCHGNMVATVARSGSAFTTGNVRTYDVWGGVRSGASSGGPRGRYVANLGHVQDDESGLIYMRARFYEPGSGRFLSEDPAGDGGNWYVYANSNPLLNIDNSGESYLQGSLMLLYSMYFTIQAIMFAFFEWKPVSAAYFALAVMCAGFAMTSIGYDSYAPKFGEQSWSAVTTGMFAVAAALAEGIGRLSKLPNGMVASMAIGVYLVTVWAAVLIALCQIPEDQVFPE